MSESSGNGDRQLLRRQDGRMVAGVCAGLAAYLKFDINLVRLAFGIFTVFYGLGVLVYLVAWAILPEEGGGDSIMDSFVRRL
jgi:phage shock protein C